jgi:UDP-N-acetylglucosamine--N-acetylmuramyl-(pentapeptide) pyrophosphoryl-undecaprenol N-acetylglucosamine transferase
MRGKVVIAGGGTGGHLFPGIAVAEEFTRRKEGWEVMFIGTGNELERRILSHWEFKLITIPAAPLKGKSGWSRIAAIAILMQGIGQSIVFLRRVSPLLVIGLGGYSAGAVVLAAYLLRIKRVIQEQNVQPGFTNRMAARFAQRVFLPWQIGAQFFPAEKVRVTGNPLRQEVLKGKEKKRGNKKFTLLILGGSQGAAAINKGMREALPLLHEIKKELHIIHQTGAEDAAWVQQGYEEYGFHASVYPFIDDMAPCYHVAHLAICRAGAATITELCAWGRASLLIPYPYAADDHQKKNAEFIVQRGAGRMISQKELSGERLAQEILALYHDQRGLHGLEQKAAALGKPDAAARIVDDCYRLLGIELRKKRV